MHGAGGWGRLCNPLCCMGGRHLPISPDQANHIWTPLHYASAGLMSQAVGPLSYITACGDRQKQTIVVRLTLVCHVCLHCP